MNPDTNEHSANASDSRRARGAHGGDRCSFLYDDRCPTAAAASDALPWWRVAAAHAEHRPQLGSEVRLHLLLRHAQLGGDADSRTRTWWTHRFCELGCGCRCDGLC